MVARIVYFKKRFQELFIPRNDSKNCLFPEVIPRNVYSQKRLQELFISRNYACYSYYYNY